MEALRVFFAQTLKAMEEHQGENEYNTRNSFYFQAFGAATYECYKLILDGKVSHNCEAEQLWEEWKPRFEKALWGE
jgi:hypothetical protein